ncbi:MAG: ubiquinone/menaquinone biosynthesis methyltransferase [Bacteroidota bacterium]
MTIERDPDRAEMFSLIAPRYDRINRVISGGLDLSWRRAILRRLPSGWAPREFLDVCCGTGTLLMMLCRRYPAAAAVGLDFAPGMLREAGERLARMRGTPPTLVLGDQNRLPFENDRFDLVTNAFGLRNSRDLDRSVAEMYRVLAPGGMMAVLELTRPRKNLRGRLFSLYFARLAPILARMLGGDRYAYAYLPDSVAGFLSREEMGQRISRLTHSPVNQTPLFGSVVSLFLIEKACDLPGSNPG